MWKECQILDSPNNSLQDKIKKRWLEDLQRQNRQHFVYDVLCDVDEKLHSSVNFKEK